MAHWPDDTFANGNKAANVRAASKKLAKSGTRTEATLSRVTPRLPLTFSLVLLRFLAK